MGGGYRKFRRGSFRSIKKLARISNGLSTAAADPRMPNPLGDPPALPVRQHKFDKYWSMPFPSILTSIKKIKTAKFRM